MTIKDPIKPRLGGGVYTLPDAAMILRLPLSRLRSWVGAYLESVNEHVPILQSWGTGRNRGFNFHVLIEAYTVYSLRKLGVSLQKIRIARDTLGEFRKTSYPFAVQGILGGGGKVLFDLQDTSPQAILNLDKGKQLEFAQIIEPFYTRLDFNDASLLAERFWPLGRNSNIVVDPHHAFGRPVIFGTNLTAETLADLVDAGEEKIDIAAQYDISIFAVQEAHDFIHLMAA
jgi:uncharacterized protein (DUF433 family)